MAKLKRLIAVVLCIGFFHTIVYAADITEEISRVANEVAQLNLGMGDYILGKKLSDDQKKSAQKNPIKKSLRGTYKFKDGEIFVVAAYTDDIVLGVYKQYPETTMDEVKKIIGGLMFDYGEPTATAHDDKIYWTYNEKGKIDQDAFEFEREIGGTKALAAIKFSSSERFTAELKEEDKNSISAYLMITSDPLSKLFLANTKQGTK